MEKLLTAGSPATPAADAERLLDSDGGQRFERGQVVFLQGTEGQHVIYVRSGGIKVTVSSGSGQEVVLAVLGPGEFCGEECLGGQRHRTSTATAIRPSVIVGFARARMSRLLHHQVLSDRFIAHMLARSIRLEGDLLDRLFGSGEARLAGALLRLALYDRRADPTGNVSVARRRLAAMSGTTTSRVSGLLAKFRALGFIDYRDQQHLTVNRSLLRVALHGTARPVP